MVMICKRYCFKEEITFYLYLEVEPTYSIAAVDEDFDYFLDALCVP